MASLPKHGRSSWDFSMQKWEFFQPCGHASLFFCICVCACAIPCFFRAACTYSGASPFVRSSVLQLFKGEFYQFLHGTSRVQFIYLIIIDYWIGNLLVVKNIKYTLRHQKYLCCCITVSISHFGPDFIVLLHFHSRIVNNSMLPALRRCDDYSYHGSNTNVI